MAFCSSAGRGDELLRRLANLDLSSSSNDKRPTVPLPPTRSNASTTTVNATSNSQNELVTITMSMRKLREGIVASQRVDTFAVQAYLFCIRLSILTKNPESYHPALLHLLRRMHTVLPLSATELQEFAGYMVLDLACRQHDLAQAYEVRRKYKIKDAKVDGVLKALVHDDYWLFWRVKGSVDGHKAKLMEWAEQGVRSQALKCLGRAYLGIDLQSLEAFTNEKWAVLVKEYGVGWLLEGSKVVIRKPKAR